MNAVTFDHISQSVITGATGTIVKQVETLLEDGLTAREILNQGLMAGMSVVGDRFRRNEMFLPQVLLSAQAMKMAVDLLKPKLLDESEEGGNAHGTVVVGTVKGDMHDIGKNLVKIMLSGAGFEVIDLGTNVTEQKFVDSLRQSGAQYVGLSALLSSTMKHMKAVIEAIRREPDLDHVRVIIGGAPVSREFAQTIGADGYAPNAASAVDVLKGMDGD